MKNKKLIKEIWDLNFKLLKFKDSKNVKFGSRREISALYKFYKFAWKKLNKSFKNSFDIGCGAGTQISILLDYKISEFAYGVDISPNAVNLCNQYLIYCNHNNFKVVNEDFQEISVKKKYQLISAIQFINFYDSTSKFFKIVDKILEKDGYLVISDGQKIETSLANKLFFFIKSNNLIRRILGKKKYLNKKKKK